MRINGARTAKYFSSLRNFSIYSQLIGRYNVDMQHFKITNKHFRQVGNSFGLLMPKHILYVLGWHTGTKLQIETTDNQIIITGPNKNDPKPKVSLFGKALAPKPVPTFNWPEQKKEAERDLDGE